MLAAARRALAARYPTYAEFEPVRRKGRRSVAAAGTARWRRRPPRLLEPDEDGRVSTAALNAEFDSLYLESDGNPRWIAKPAVACLWARTVRCGGCRAEIPLLKTRWLCKKPKKRVRLTLEPRPDDGGVDLGIEHGVPEGDGNPAQRREHDRALGAGTMSASGARCPGCGAIATTKDIRAEGLAGRLGARMTAVVVEGQTGKEYRLPTPVELDAARVGRAEIDALYAEIPFGLPDESIVAERPSPNSRGASGLPRYGFDTWRTLFTDRQLLALGTFVRAIRGCSAEMRDYPDDWREAIVAWLAPSISRLADRCCALATWQNDSDKIGHAFARFALPMVWDFAESCPLADTTGGFIQAVEWIARVVEHTAAATAAAPPPRVELRSATEARTDRFDLVCTDPPYYDAIPYSDLMDFFHVWLRRTLHGLSPDVDAAFAAPLGPKWDAAAGDGELVDQPGRFERGRRTVPAGVRRRHAAHLQPRARGAAGRRAAGRGVRQQAAGGVGDAGVGADPGRLRRRRLVADPDRARQPRSPAAPACRPPSGSSAGSAPPPPARAGTTRCWPTCRPTWPGVCGPSGTPTSAGLTSSGPRPAPPSRRSAGIQWSGRPMSRANG